MNSIKTFLFLFCLAVLALLAGMVVMTPKAGAAKTPMNTRGVKTAQEKAASDADKLVYADFETMKDNRPVSSHGGLVQLFSYQENAANPARHKGLEGANPPAPELVRLNKEDPNRAAAFDLELRAPNEYAGAGIEVRGQPEKDGKLVPDDVSSYKYLSLQMYASKGVSSVRLEVVSAGQGLGNVNAYPQITLKVSPSLNTFKIPVKALTQPQWAQPRVSPKDVLKKLTSVKVNAYCDKCTTVQGTLIIDNIVFHN